MPIVQQLAVLALQPLMGESASTLFDLLDGQLPAFSQRLQQALRRAADRAWDSLEIALAGGLWWGQIQTTLRTEEGRIVSQQLLAFLDALPIAGLERKTLFRHQCLREARQARAEGLLAGSPEPAALENQLRCLAKAHPQAIQRAQGPPLETIAGQVTMAGHPNLGWLLRQHSPSAASLLVLAVRYFFRAEVEADAELARGLHFRQVELLSRRQQTCLDGLNEVLRYHGTLLDRLLGEWLQGVEAARTASPASPRVEPQLLQVSRFSPTAGVRGTVPAGRGMGLVQVFCPSCRQRLSAARQGGAVPMRCPLCGGLFVLPVRPTA
jgi:hypothetical protein